LGKEDLTIMPSDGLKIPCRAVFLDRDGTLIVHRPYLSEPAGVELLEGTREAVAQALTHGTKLFLFTNQSGVGRGLFSLADVEGVNRRMIELLGLGRDPFSGVCIATERPEEPPRYRKPSPRYIEEMLWEHGIPPQAAWMLGDSPVDWEAGLNAGVNVAAIVGDSGDAHRERREQLAVPPYENLLEWWRSVQG
jgi:D-glycero-D-manno-heptose 1,7-bisphosphate phosphatase